MTNQEKIESLPDYVRSEVAEMLKKYPDIQIEVVGSEILITASETDLKGVVEQMKIKSPDAPPWLAKRMDTLRDLAPPSITEVVRQLKASEAFRKADDD